MKLLIIGKGGREHALATFLAKDERVETIFCAPGSGGTQGIFTPKTENIDISSTDVYNLRTFAKNEKIDLTIVGPETSLENGIVDCFLEKSLPIFGPSKAAANIETQKIYSKHLMKFLRIPTAKFMSFTSTKDAIQVFDFLNFPRKGVVVKANGLAAGKGVYICRKKIEAQNILANLPQQFGEAGEGCVIEEILTGKEISFFVLTDGLNAVPLGYAKDYKRAWDGDTGPNTGGMGAICSPHIDLSAQQTSCIMMTIVHPLLSYLREIGSEYKGLLYVGLMMVKEKPYVLEFNARFGDPETQALLRRVQGDLLTPMLQIADRSTHSLQSSFSLSDETALCVNLVSKGYPTQKDYEQLPLFGLRSASNIPTVEIYHAGTELRGGEWLYSDGGRVLNVTATDLGIDNVRNKVYTALRRIDFGGRPSYVSGHYRKDIGDIYGK